MGQKNSMRYTLLGSVSAAALLTAYPVKVAQAQNEIIASETSDDTTGLQETTAGNTAALINSNDNVLTFGADATAGLTVNGTTANLTLTINATGNANAVRFKGDIIVTGANDALTINHLNNTVIFEGNITSTAGGAIDINSGNASSNLATIINVDTLNAENLSIDATIDAVDAGDTVTLNLLSTNAAAVRTTTFKKAIGGDVGIDVINIGADATATAKIFEAGVNATTMTIGSAGNVINLVNFHTATDGTSNTVTSNIDVANATGTDTITILDSSSTTADTVTFSGTVGASSVVIDNVNVGNATSAGNAVFSGTFGNGAAVAALNVISGNASNETSSATYSGATIKTTAITLTETGGVDATIKFNGTTQTVAGTINGGTANNTGILLIDSTVSLTTSGVIGAIKPLANITVASTDGANATGILTKTSSAQTITLGNAGSTADTATLILRTTGGGSSAITVTGLIDGTATDTTVLTIDDAGTGAAADVVTVASNVGATTPVTTINVGGANNGGQAAFAGTVAATNLTIDSGNAAGETGAAAIAGAASITTITVRGGENNANNDSALAFSSNLTSTSITLDSSLGEAAIKFVTGTDTVSTTVIGTIDGAASGEGKLAIQDSNTSTDTETVTFASKIGATNKLKSISVGTGTGALTAGRAIFSETVEATTIAVNAADTNNADPSAGTFNGAVIGNISVTAGDNDSEDATATFNADLTATTINVTEGTSGDSTVVFGGTSAITISGVVDAGGAGTGLLTISGTDVNLATGVTVGQTSKLETVLISGTAKFASTTSIDASAINLTGTIHAGDTIKIGDVAASQADLGNSTNAKIVMTSPVATYDGGVIINADDNNSSVLATNTIDVTPHASFTSGSIILITGGTRQVVTDGKVLVAATTLATYAVSDASNVVTITATAKSAAATAAEIGISTQQAEAVGAAAVATAGDATVTLALNTALAAGGTEAVKAAKQVINDAGALSATGGASASAGAASFAAVGTRLASLRERSHKVAYASGDASLGFAAGSGPMADTVWLKPFYGTGDQRLRNDIDGYRSDTTGMAAGWDTTVSEGTKVGLYGSFSITDIDGRGVADAQSEITTQLFGVYGDYTTNDYYVEGMVAYGRNNVTSDRLIDFGGLSLRARGEFTSSQYQAKIGAGAPLDAGGMFITPNASLSYTKVHGQSFVETNAGTLNLAVNQDDTTVLLGQAGVKLHANIKDDGGTWIPEFRANVMNDFSSDEATSTSQFANGLGTAFNVTGADVAELSGSLGVGMMYEVDNVKVGVSYDYVAKADYHGHNGTISARWNF